MKKVILTIGIVCLIGITLFSHLDIVSGECNSDVVNDDTITRAYRFFFYGEM